LIINQLEEEAGISKTTYHEILTENLGMHYVAAKSVQCLLSEDQKQNRVDVRKELVSCANTNENFLNNSVTDDKNWFYCYDVETKAMGPKNVTQTQKSMASSDQSESDADFFFECGGIIHHEFLPCGQRVNMEYYLKVMKRQREAVRRNKD
jgi:hypothetical protein